MIIKERGEDGEGEAETIVFLHLLSLLFSSIQSIAYHITRPRFLFPQKNGRCGVRGAAMIDVRGNSRHVTKNG